LGGACLLRELTGIATNATTCTQGPVARIWVEEISLGRTRGAKKAYDGIARAAASSKWRLPFMVRALGWRGGGGA
jgi:hypothetical protein